MELVVIFGPSAVGKMAVGFELEKVTGYKLFHNHMTIELVHNFFEFDEEPFRKLVVEFRNRLFEEIKSSSIKGIIFTYVWALNMEEDHQEIIKYCNALGKNIDDVYFVELEASQMIRLERNRTELRLKNKKTKNNIENSEKNLIQSDKLYKLNTDDSFFYKNYIKINNENLSPTETALIIKSKFGLRKLTTASTL